MACADYLVHLAKNWKAGRSANEASLAIFFLQKKRVLKDA